MVDRMPPAIIPGGLCGRRLTHMHIATAPHHACTWVVMSLVVGRPCRRESEFGEVLKIVTFNKNAAYQALIQFRDLAVAMRARSELVPHRIPALRQLRPDCCCCGCCCRGGGDG